MSQKDPKEEQAFACSRFIIADEMATIINCSASQFDAIQEKDKQGEIIIESIQQPIKCIAVHPSEPYLAIAGDRPYFCIWNYQRKDKLNIEYTHNEDTNPTSMEYTPDGKCLIVGYQQGLVRFLELEMIDLENIHQKIKLKEIQAGIKISDNYDGNHKATGDLYMKASYEISGIVISHDSKMFATMDTHCGVTLFKKDYRFGDPREPIEWNFCGKIRSHQIEITSISFGESLDENEQNKLRLFSIG